jgi:predicted dehydrogenase
MLKNQNRRIFLKNTIVSASGLGLLASSNTPHFTILSETSTPKIKFSVVGINHNHIFGMSNAVIRGGGELVSFYAKEDDLAAEFSKRYPQATRATTATQVYEDKTIQLILSASIPNQRALVGIEAMKHGKDFLADKPGITNLKQLAEVKKIQKQTNRIYSIMYSERFENRATVKAGELVKSGAIGKVIQTAGFGPHRMNPKTRPSWFFEKDAYGGIITDIASHQFDQFLYFTNSTEAKIVASQVGNLNHPQYPGIEDFGDVMLRGNGGTGYIRVDWFTPDGLKTWGDGRLTILGTEGYIEVRKNIDINQFDTPSHLYLVNNKETVHIDCGKEILPFGEQLVNDILNRTETAMTQAHCFLATELALKAQKMASKLVSK